MVTECITNQNTMIFHLSRKSNTCRPNTMHFKTTSLMISILWIYLCRSAIIHSLSQGTISHINHLHQKITKALANAQLLRFPASTIRSTMSQLLPFARNYSIIRLTVRLRRNLRWCKLCPPKWLQRLLLNRTTSRNI